MLLPIIGLTLATSCALPTGFMGSAPIAAPATSSVTLAWDPVTSSAVQGYTVHYGQTSGVFPSVADAGNKTSTTISGLISGQTYYFVVTAHDSSGGESQYSNEITYTIPTK